MDLRLVPSALLAWACAWMLTGEVIPGWVICSVGLVIGWLGRGRPGVWGAGIVVSVVALITMGWVHVVTASAPAAWCRDGAHLTAIVRIRTESTAVSSPFASQHLAEATVLTMDARGGSWRGRLPIDLMMADPTSLPSPGSVISVSGTGAGVHGSERSVGTIHVEDVELVSDPGPVDGLANSLRSGLVVAMGSSRPEQAALVPSLVVGDTSALDEALEEEFRLTGLTHVLAVSGSNLSLALAFTGWVARWLGVRGWWLRLSAVGVGVLFVVTCRAEPSVLRATVMGMIALGATGLGPAAGRSARNLSLAAILLLCSDPWLARSWGFALSVAATAGIVWWAPRWEAHCPEWIPMWLRQSLFISLAAQLATQPLATALSDQVSLVAPVANLCVGPFIGPVTVLGLLAATSSLVSPPLGLAIGWVAGWFVQPVLSVAHLMSQVPGATLVWPAQPVFLGLLGGICVILGQWAVPVLVQRRWTTMLVATSLVVVLLVPPRQYGWRGDWAVVACDVGQGGAIVFRAASSAAIVVDTGPEPSLLRRCLSSLGVDRISLLVLTHPHADHTGGLSALTGAPVDMALVGDDRSAEIVAERLGLSATRAVGDQEVVVGEVTWRTLAVGPVGDSTGESETDSPAENDAGIVGVITTPGLRVMVTGDLEEAGQRRLVELGGDLSADVLVVPHHGSARQDPEFIRAVAARISIIQVGEDNPYGHPTRSALTLVESTGGVWRTDRDGAIAVNVDGTRVTTQR